jgi:hypothetical protein
MSAKSSFQTYRPTLLIVGVMAIVFAGYILFQVMTTDTEAMRVDRHAIETCESSASRDAGYRGTCEDLREEFRLKWKRAP